jgi:hypothetical protein
MSSHVEGTADLGILTIEKVDYFELDLDDNEKANPVVDLDPTDLSDLSSSSSTSSDGENEQAPHFKLGDVDFWVPVSDCEDNAHLGVVPPSESDDMSSDFEDIEEEPVERHRYSKKVPD